MPEKTSVDLGSVQKTLFLPLWGRATESQKPHPLIVDRKAVEIISSVDFEFSVMAANIHEITERAWVVRALIIDDVVRVFLRQHQHGTVVNIGCGLDTTFDRIDNGSVHWYDLDLPDVITLRRSFLPEHERRRFMSVSFLETSWFQQIRVVDQVLFIAAGVFYYSEKSEIREFLRRVADAFPESEIIFDVCSEQGAKIANKEVITKSGLDEKSFLKWGIRNTQEILAWDNRIQLLDQHRYFRRRKKGLTMRNKILAAISDLIRVQWLLHLKFARS